MDITTTGVNLGEEEELLEIKTEYVLGMNGQKVADCQMHIRVTPKQQRDYIFQSIIKIGPPDQLLIDMQCNKKRSLSSITGK